jgi:hypothetical protein
MATKVPRLNNVATGKNHTVPYTNPLSPQVHCVNAELAGLVDLPMLRTQM